MPVYNAENYIYKCIQSILLQEYESFELILVDDGSTDISGEICDNYAGKDDRVRVIHKKNAGVSAARNTGIKSAKGKYITFVDADDWIHKKYLKTLVEGIKKYHAELSVVGDQKLMINEEFRYEDNITSRVFTRDEIFLELIKDGIIQGYVWGKLFVRDIIKKYNIEFDENIKMNEDLVFCCEYIDKISKAFYSSSALYAYVQNENSAIGSQKYEILLTRDIAIERLMDLCKTKPDEIRSAMCIKAAEWYIGRNTGVDFAHGVFNKTLIKRNLRLAEEVKKEKKLPAKPLLKFYLLKLCPRITYRIYCIVKGVK